MESLQKYFLGPNVIHMLMCGLTWYYIQSSDQFANLFQCQICIKTFFKLYVFAYSTSLCDDPWNLLSNLENPSLSLILPGPLLLSTLAPTENQKSKGHGASSTSQFLLILFMIRVFSLLMTYRSMKEHFWPLPKWPLTCPIQRIEG